MKLNLQKPIIKVSVQETHIIQQPPEQSAPSLTIEQVEKIYRHHNLLEDFIREMMKESQYKDSDYWGTIHWFLEHIPSSRCSQNDHIKKVYKERILPRFAIKRI